MDKEEMICPNCKLSAYLYKERNEEGINKITCSKCGWESKELEHLQNNTDTLAEKKKLWE